MKGKDSVSPAWASVLVAILGFVDGAVVHAQPVIELRPGAESLQIGPHVEILEDPDRRLTLADVTEPAVADRFATGHASVPAFGYTRSSFWLRMRIQRPRQVQEEWYLLLSNKSIDHIELYVRGESDPVLTGDAHPFRTRPIADREFVFPLTIPEHGLLLHMRVESRGPVYLPLHLLSRDGFIAHTRRSNFLLGGLVATLLVFALFHLGFYVAARDTSYLYYVAFLGAFLLYNMAVARIAFQYLWPDNTWIGDRANSILGVLSFMLAIQFTRSFLNTRFVVPNWDKTLIAGMFVAALLMAMFLGGLNQTLAVLTVVYCVAVLLLILVCAALAVRRRQPAARHYLVAWSFLIAGTLATMLGYLSVLPPHFFAGAKGVQVGSAVTFTLFAVALGHRFRQMNRARRQLRMKLAGDLHDDIGAGLTEIALTSYLIRTRPQSEDVPRMASEIEIRARALADSMRDIVWAVEPTRETWEDLEKRLRDTAMSLLQPAGIDVEMDGTVDDPQRPLPLEVRQNILLIFKEAAHNAVKHARCGRLIVTWSIDRNQIRLRIEDDGIGFQVDGRHDGNGLMSMRRRAEVMGGATSIQSEPGGGTAISVEATLSD